MICNKILNFVILLPFLIVSVYAQNENENGELVSGNSHEFITERDENLNITFSYPSDWYKSNTEEDTIVLKSDPSTLNEITITTSGKLYDPCNYVYNILHYLTNTAHTLESLKPGYLDDNSYLRAVLTLGGFLNIDNTFIKLNDEILTIGLTGYDIEKERPYYNAILSSLYKLNKDSSEEQCDYSVVVNKFISEGVLN